MSYKDKDKQREYQRLWAQTKKKGENFQSQGRRDVFIRREDGSFNLKRASVTWEELSQVQIEKLDSFDKCVKEGKKLVFGRRINRIAIASIAMRAVKIRVGGDRRSSEYQKSLDSKRTVASFSKELGISNRTLDTWIKIKTVIIDKLPKEIEEINWTAADKALDVWRKEGGDPQTIYQKFANEDPFIKNAQEAERIALRLKRIFRAVGTKGFESTQLEKITSNLIEALSIIKKETRNESSSRPQRNVRNQRAFSNKPADYGLHRSL